MLWLNGDLIREDAARIDPADRGFTLGDGLFETIRADAGVPCRLPRHLARMRDGAAMLGMVVPFDDEAIAAACARVLAGSGLKAAALRLTLTRGPGPRGVAPPVSPAPTMLITAGDLPGIAPPARLVTCLTTRRNEHSPLSRIKSLNYLDGIIARREALLRDADDAILLNTAGRVAESSAANLVARLDGIWVTPPVGDGALPGIARGLLLEAGIMGERSLGPDELARVEAAFLCNSLGRREVASIDGRALALGLDHVMRDGSGRLFRNDGAAVT